MNVLGTETAVTVLSDANWKALSGFRYFTNRDHVTSFQTGFECMLIDQHSNYANPTYFFSKYYIVIFLNHLSMCNQS